MIIRPMAEQDWRRVKAIRLAALADTPDAFGTTLAEDEARPDAEWRARLAATDRVTFVAELTGEDMGLVVCAPFEGLQDTAGLFAMWTAPEARQSGIGSALVQAVVDWARQKGYKKVALDVADANQAAIALYEKHGFMPTGEVSTLPPPRTHVTEQRRECVL